KYGFTTNYVVGLEVVLPDGAVVELGGPELDAPGYDLIGAFVGSEGTLGVATRVWLRVVAVPSAVRTLVAFFDSMPAAGHAVSQSLAASIVPAAIELMDAVTIAAAEQMAHPGFPEGCPAALLVEVDGAPAEVAVEVDQVVAACERAGATEIRPARD